MTYSIAVPMNNISPINFNIAKAVKNKANYISTITYQGGDPDLYLMMDNNLNVWDNIDSMNTRGHFEHQEYKAHKMFTGKEATDFRQYLKSTRRPTAKTEGYVIINKTGTRIAGVYHDKFTQNAAPSISMGFHEVIAKEARETGKSFKSVELHTILHEIAHTPKTPRNIVNNLIYNFNPFSAERYSEELVFEYAINKSKETDNADEKKMWLEIADIAENRYNNVKKIYSRRNRKNIDSKVKDEKGSENRKQDSKYEEKKGGQEENIGKDSEEVNPEDGKHIDDVVEECSEGESGGEVCESAGEVSE